MQVIFQLIKHIDNSKQMEYSKEAQHSTLLSTFNQSFMVYTYIFVTIFLSKNLIVSAPDSIFTTEMAQAACFNYLSITSS